MRAYLCRWPNGVLSIVAAETERGAVKQLMADAVCSVEDATGPNENAGIVMPLPEGMRVHLELTDDGFVLRGWPTDAVPTLKTLYPHLMAVLEQSFKSEKAARAATVKAVAIECGRSK